MAVNEPAGGDVGRIDRAAFLIAVLGATAIIIVSASVLVDVLMRWLLDAPVLWVDDLTNFNVAVAVVCCLPAGLVGKRLVTIRFLGKAMGRRAEAWLELLGDLFTLVFFIVLAWQFAAFSAEAGSSGLASMVLQIPQAPWWWVVTAVLVITVPFQAVVVVRSCVIALAGGRR